MSNIINIHTDGGSRGNPGPSGIGAVIEFDGQKKEYSEFIGQNRTNNEAEYEALIFALKKVKQLVGKEKAKQAELNCFSDSELMVRQLNHQYKIQDEKICVYFLQIWNMMLDFSKVNFYHVLREKNKEADRLANQAMDQSRLI